MPLLHTIMLFALFGQAYFFLQLNSDIAKFLRLFSRALSDIKYFLVVELYISSLMAAVMQVLGTKFDDGGNMDLSGEDGYDTNFNDYPLVWSYGVNIISIYRNAVGDLQMPTYDYWAA